MGLKCGIVGLPNVGKSTLFNSLTKAGAKAQNFPFCTIEPNVGIVPVPDERLNKLAALVKPEKITPAAIEIRDIAGLVQGASKGEGLGNRFLANIRETDAIIHVVRCFEDDNVAHVDTGINPLRDKEVVDYELLLKDLETVEKAILKVEKAALGASTPQLREDARRKQDAYKEVKLHLESGKPLRSMPLKEEEAEIIDALFLITAKPVLYVCNVDEQAARGSNEYVKQMEEAVKEENGHLLSVTAAIEAEIANMDDESDRQLFMDELGLAEPGVDRLIRAAYQLLGLITFFTAGETEVRAWTIRKDTSAQRAAGEIHSDLERGFICAEITKYQDFVQIGSEHECRVAGRIATVGRDYIMQDGDVAYFRFNV